MLVQAEQEDILSGGLGQGNKFSIASSAKAFEILSSNLYQNKILAVIREISCNAADAHKVAGVPLGEIEIHLPTFGEPFFSVRDFGPSLTDAEVRHLYTTYFQSSKDSNNDLIGGFGLGSKAPFSVADQFTLTAWQDGQQRQYVCYKDGGVPAINFIDSKPSAQRRGFEVWVAVPSSQLSTWVIEAARFFGWWPQAPKFIGHQPRIDSWLDAKNFAVRSADSVQGAPAWAFTNGGGARVLMGLVPYRLEFSAIPLLSAAEVSVYSNMNLLLSFEIGELEINPSRETLSYNPATCVAIKKRLDFIKAHLETEFNKTLVGCTTMLEARRKAFSKGSDQVRGLLERLTNSRTKAALWNGKQIKARVVLELQKDFPEPLSIFLAHKPSYRTTWRKDSGHYDFSHNVTQEPNITANTGRLYLWSPTAPTAKTYKNIQYWFEQNPPQGLDYYGNVTSRFDLTAHIFVPPAGSAMTMADVNKVLAEQGVPLLQDIGVLPPAPKVAPSGKVRVASKTTGYSFVTGGWTRTEDEIDLAGGGYFVEFFDGQPKIDAGTMRNMLGLIEGGDKARLIGLPRRKLETQKLQKQLAEDGWTEFSLDSAKLFDAKLVEAVAFKNYLCERLQLQREIRAELNTILRVYKANPAKTPTAWANIAKSLEMYGWAAYIYTNPALGLVTDPALLAAVQAGKDAGLQLDLWQKAFGVAHPLLNQLSDWNKVPVDALLDYLNRA